MTLLQERWPGLTKLSHVSLGNFPTPVERMKNVCESTGRDAWIKRDDLSGTLYGGNKVRKLEYLLGDARARGADTIITVGAVGSHHVLATATYGRELGLHVHAIVGPQPSTPHALDNARCALAVGATLHPVINYALLPPRMLALRASLAMKKKNVVVIPVGGSTVQGALGYVEAGLEIAHQIGTRELPEPKAIFVAFGTGGSVAGLAVGLAAAGVQTQVIATRVTWPAVSSKRALRKLIHETVTFLRETDPLFPDVSDLALSMIRIEGRELGRGYGISTASGEHAKSLASSDGIVLETTYTAKTLAALTRLAPSFPAGTPLLYVHTLSSANLTPLLLDAPELPSAIAKLARKS
jgi:D-cysteine desulfhydrase